MILEWLQTHQIVLWWLGGMSVVTFLGTLIALPILVVRIPADYFARDPHHRQDQHTRHAGLRGLGLIVRNVLGLLLVLAGIAMLVLPGQGILTILIGIMAMDFPGKHTLERHIVQQPAVLRSINWIRRKAHRPPLVGPTSDVRPPSCRSAI